MLLSMAHHTVARCDTLLIQTAITNAPETEWLTKQAPISPAPEGSANQGANKPEFGEDHLLILRWASPLELSPD